MVFVKLICKKKLVNKFVECKLSNWTQGIAWYLTFASVSYQVLSNKNKKIIQFRVICYKLSVLLSGQHQPLEALPNILLT